MPLLISINHSLRISNSLLILCCFFLENYLIKAQPNYTRGKQFIKQISNRKKTVVVPTFYFSYFSRWNNKNSHILWMSRIRIKKKAFDFSLWLPFSPETTKTLEFQMRSLNFPIEIVTLTTKTLFNFGFEIVKFKSTVSWLC